MLIHHFVCQWSLGGSTIEKMNPDSFCPCNGHSLHSSARDCNGNHVDHSRYLYITFLLSDLIVFMVKAWKGNFFPDIRVACAVISLSFSSFTLRTTSSYESFETKCWDLWSSVPTLRLMAWATQ